MAGRRWRRERRTWRYPRPLFQFLRMLRKPRPTRNGRHEARTGSRRWLKPAEPIPPLSSDPNIMRPAMKRERRAKHRSAPASPATVPSSMLMATDLPASRTGRSSRCASRSSFSSQWRWAWRAVLRLFIMPPARPAPRTPGKLADAISTRTSDCGVQLAGLSKALISSLGGASSNAGTSPGKVTHGCLLLTQTWACGRSLSVSSSVPALNKAIPGRAGFVL